MKEAVKVILIIAIALLLNILFFTAGAWIFARAVGYTDLSMPEFFEMVLMWMLGWGG